MGMLLNILKTSPFSPTLRALRFDLIKCLARLRTVPMKRSYLKANGKIPSRLHFGCGVRKVQGWLNVDITRSDIDIDFSRGLLPFDNGAFQLIVSQHVLEHFEIKRELAPILVELHRVLDDDGVIYISCPSILKVCTAYLKDRGLSLIDGRKIRFPNFTMHNFPPSQIVNELFHQDGEHKNLLDIEIITFILERAGFKDISEISERKFLDEVDGFPPRNDDEQSIYVRARKYIKT